MLRKFVINAGVIFNDFILCPRAYNLYKHGDTCNPINGKQEFVLKRSFRSDRGMASNANQSIVWMDMEMSGLDVFKDHILEIACLVTDEQLNVKSTDFHLIINQPETVLNTMNEWCTATHETSGLIDACKKSTVTLESAEQQLLKFLKQYIPEKCCPLAGNTIYMDRLFLRRYMPIVDEYLHYRIIDVSTVGELARRWNSPMETMAPKKQRSHRAIDDIRESIDQLKYYRSNFFKLSH